MLWVVPYPYYSLLAYLLCNRHLRVTPLCVSHTFRNASCRYWKKYCDAQTKTGGYDEGIKILHRGITAIPNRQSPNTLAFSCVVFCCSQWLTWLSCPALTCPVVLVLQHRPMVLLLHFRRLPLRGSGCDSRPVRNGHCRCGHELPCGEGATMEPLAVHGSDRYPV